MGTRYAVIYHPTRTGWSAHAPDVPGCIATGKTRPKVERIFAEALEFHFEGMRAYGDAIPEPVTDVGYVEVLSPGSLPAADRAGTSDPLTTGETAAGVQPKTRMR